jgi:mannose-1-phosphate guanylyltransferase/mannose-6-phosphate isomerase
MPADHVIVDVQKFQEVVSSGIGLAEQGEIVTFGIIPESPGTGYGYIQSGEPVSPESLEGHAYRIIRFAEKPDVASAKAYLDAGSYFWNSGLFMMRASVWLSSMDICRSDILTACRKAWADRSVDGDFIRVKKEEFAACPSDSIDYAVMERIPVDRRSSLPGGVVIPLSAGWSDVGAWDSLWKVLPKNDSGNVAQGDVLLHDCRNMLVMSENRLVACVGTENMVVIETPDAVLVAPLDKAQDVKQIVDNLKRNERPEGQLHRKVFRPWGSYDGIDIGERFQVKRIVVKPGAALSLQMHHHRAEHWIVVRGTAQVTRGDTSFLVSENESTFIPLGTRHRLENPGCVPLEMIEVQSGSYLGEDDIVRFDDIYGRNES